MPLCGKCDPTLLGPLVKVEGAGSRIHLRVWPAHPGSYVIVSMRGGEDRSCVVVARAKANSWGVAKVPLPTGLYGHVYAHCNHCDTTSQPVRVDT